MSDDRAGRIYTLEKAALGAAIIHEDRAAEILAQLAEHRFEDPRAASLFELLNARLADDADLDPRTLKGLLPIPYPSAFIGDAMAQAPHADAVPALARELASLAQADADEERDIEAAILPLAVYAAEEPLDLPGEVIPGMVRGSVSFLHGSEGIGKTALALQLAIAKTVGVPWLSTPIVESGPVFMLAQETPLPELQARARAIADHEGLELSEISSRLSIVSETELGGRYLNLRRDIDRLARTIEAGRAELVIVDHLSSFSPDERDLGQVDVVESLRRLAVSTGAALLVLDHDNKAGVGERASHAGRAWKRRAAGATFWLGGEARHPFLDVGKARNLSADEKARIWLRWRSLPDPWARESAGRPVTWGYLERAPEAPPSSNGNGAATGSRREALADLVPCDYTDTASIVALAARGGLYTGDDETVARSVRRDLSRLAELGDLDRLPGSGRVSARWRKRG